MKTSTHYVSIPKHFISRLFTCLACSFLLAMQSAVAATDIFCGIPIGSSGQYILQTDLNCAAPAITVTASNVHIDLNQKTLTGNGGGIGIDVQGPVSNVHINGGTVTGYFIGIELNTSTKSHVNGMILFANSVNMKVVGGSGNRINGNMFDSSTSASLVLDATSDNKVNTNKFKEYQTGIDLFDSSDNIINSNTLNGEATNAFFGITIFSGTGNTIRGNTTLNHSIHGIGVSDLSTLNTIQGNTSMFNGTDMVDENEECDDNKWKANTFDTEQVDGGADTEECLN